MSQISEVIITDTHLNEENIELVESLFDQTLQFALDNGLKRVFHGGDIFDIRKYQTLAVLKSFIRILRRFEEKGVDLYAIPGNHDKPNYKSKDSYLDVFERYPSFKLIRDYECFQSKEHRFHLIPFFDEKEVYGEYLSQAIKAIQTSSPKVKGRKEFLLTHRAVNGARNNDGTVVEEILDINEFQVFDKVFVGHYHDHQIIGNVIYIGSSHQTNYGENADKGLTVFYDNGETERHLLDFPIFETIKIDLNTISEEELKELTAFSSQSQTKTRFKFSGTREKLAGLDKHLFLKQGIDVKTEIDDPEVDLDYTELVEFEGFDVSSIQEEWKEFVEKHKIQEDLVIEGQLRMKSKFENQ